MKKQNKDELEASPDRREEANSLYKKALELTEEIMDLFKEKEEVEKEFRKLKKLPSGRMKYLKEELEYSKRAKWIWECLRRNKDYIHDFELSKKAPYNRTLKRELEKKWRFPEEDLELFKENLSESERNDPELMKWTLSDPDEGWQWKWMLGYYPHPDSPRSWVSFMNDYSGNIEIFRLGQEEVIKGGWRKSEHWEIKDLGEYEKLTEKNCPRHILLDIEIQPWFSKETIKKSLMEEFERAYELIKDAQATVVKKKTLGPRDDESFENFMIAYDYQQKGLNVTEIALKMFPDATHENKKRTRINPNPEAKKEVEYFLKRADYYINQGGWKEL